MHLDELQQLVAKGESECVEFKTTTGQRTEAAKTICAFLNGLGGFVFFASLIKESMMNPIFKNEIKL